MKQRDLIVINAVITVASAVLMVLVKLLAPELGQTKFILAEALVIALWAIFCGVNTWIYFKNHGK